MVSTTTARNLTTTNINDNTAGDVTPADVRGAILATLDAIDRVESSVNVMDYGAKLDGTTDDTVAWNTALATGKNVSFPEGISKITGKLSFSAIEGSAIIGAGRNKSSFKIDYASFNMAASAVIELNAVYQGCRGFTMKFTQPSVSVRSSIKVYPPAINLNGQSRAELSALRMESCHQGILAVGNCGGAVIDDIQMGCLSRGLFVDGALDSVRIDRFHFWPFGFAGDSNLMTVYHDSTTKSIEIGRCDDLNMSSILSFEARMIFGDYGSGGCFGVASNITLDADYGRIEFSAGEMTMSSVYGSSAATDDFVIKQTGGELKISSLAIEGPGTPAGLVIVQGGAFMASNIQYTTSSSSARAFVQSGGTMLLNGGKFIDLQNATRSVPLIDVTGGRTIITNLQVNDRGAATGDFIRVAVDDYHIVAHNNFLGWGLSLPAAPDAGIYGPNIATASAYVSSQLVGKVKVKTITGTLDASGNVTVAHGVVSGLTRIITASAFYTNASGFRVAISGISFDGTNMTLTATASGASRAYSLYITYA